MSVADVWGRVDGQDVGLITRGGDEWYFSLPPGISGDFPAEFWAEDEAGNQSYRSAMLSIADGAVKCVRMLRTDGICRMLAQERPSISMVGGRGSCTMLPFVCPRMGVMV